jgi:hypothetical protein
MIKIVGGIAVGAAAMMLAPSALSVLSRSFKPFAKALIKGGLLACEAAKEAIQHSQSVLKRTAQSTQSALSGAAESIEDLAAEAKAELAESQKAPVKSRKKKEA